jgi:hypothetical protein
MRSRLVTGIAVAVATFLLVTNPVVADAAKQISGGQVKNGSLTGKDVKDGSLTGADVRDGSLTPADISGLSKGSLGLTTVQVNANGSLATTSLAGVASTELTGGQYAVTFPADVSSCVPFADSGSSGDSGLSGFAAIVEHRLGQPTQIFVQMDNTSGAPTDRAFHLLLVC